MCAIYHFLYLFSDGHGIVVMYFGSYDIGYAIPSLYHVCMDFNEGFTHERARERESSQEIQGDIVML